MSRTRAEPFLERLRSNWVMLVVLCGIGTALVAGSLFLKHLNEGAQRDLTATTTAHVLAGAKEHSDRSCGSDGHGCHTDYTCDFEYEYTPAGATKPYQDSWQDDGECDESDKAGATRTAHYDPDRLSEVTLIDPNSKGQKHAWLWALGPGLLCFVLAGWGLRD